MEIVIPSESKEFPGYYVVPGESAMAVSPDGKFINVRTGKPIKPGPINDGYWKISIFYQGKTTNWYVHRLLARTFIGRPDRHLDKDHSVLEVNHIDTDKSNNTLGNLEWVTPVENIRHAIGLDRFDYTPVLCKHLTNGAIIEMKSIKECAAKFGISYRRLRKHLMSREAGTRTKNWFVFKYADDTPWPELREKDYQENTWDVRFGVWYAKDEETGKTYFNRTLEDLCDVLGLVYTAAQSAFRSSEEKRYRGYVFWYDDRPVEDVVKSITTVKKVPEGVRAPMKIKVLQGNIETVYDSSIKAGKALDVSPTTVTYAIKNKQGRLKDYIVSYI